MTIGRPSEASTSPRADDHDAPHDALVRSPDAELWRDRRRYRHSRRPARLTWNTRCRSRPLNVRFFRDNLARRRPGGRSTRFGTSTVTIGASRSAGPGSARWQAHRAQHRSQAADAHPMPSSVRVHTGRAAHRRTEPAIARGDRAARAPRGGTLRRHMSLSAGRLRDTGTTASSMRSGRR